MIGECIHFIATGGGLVGVMFAAGLTGGFTHCAGMCGPFVIAQTGRSGAEVSLSKISKAALLPYHAGRVTTYVALAVFANTALNLAFVASPLKALLASPMLILAGVIFLINAFPRLGVLFPWAVSARLPLPTGWLSAASKRLLNAPGPFRRYLLGVLLGFMPCGLVLSALLAASTAGHAWQAALAMAAFTAGTAPALIVTAWGGHVFKALFPGVADYAVRGLMAFNGVWLIAIAGFLLG